MNPNIEVLRGLVAAASRVSSFLDHANLDTSKLPAGMGSALRALRSEKDAALAAMAARAEAHPDDAAVDAFAAAMKAKLAEARAKGRGGWQDKADCPHQRLSDMLRAHVEKGDPRDVANFACFLWNRGEGILPAAQPEAQEPPAIAEFVLALLISGGFVTQAKADEARKIALGGVPGSLSQPEAQAGGEVDVTGFGTPPLMHDERSDAEKLYSLTAFDYAAAPIGSRDWTIYWRGWWHRSLVYGDTTPPPGAVPEGWREFIQDCALNRDGVHDASQRSARAISLLAAAPGPKEGV